MLRLRTDLEPERHKHTPETHSKNAGRSSLRSKAAESNHQPCPDVWSPGSKPKVTLKIKPRGRKSNIGPIRGRREKDTRGGFTELSTQKDFKIKKNPLQSKPQQNTELGQNPAAPADSPVGPQRPTGGAVPGIRLWRLLRDQPGQSDQPPALALA